MISGDKVGNLIYIHDGIADNTLSNFATPGSLISGLTYDTNTGNLISCDSGTSTIYVHTGVTSTISTSFAAPGGSPRGLAFDGINLISCDSTTIYIHSGVTATVSSSFAAPDAVLNAIAYDGANLISVGIDSDKIYVHNGVSATITKSFNNPGTLATGIIYAPSFPEPVDGNDFTAYISGGEARKAETTISGLTHLEGKEVIVMADGDVIRGKTVSSGTITLDHARALVHVGLPITRRVKLLPIEKPLELGTSQGKDKKLLQANIQFYKT
jgi:hypothetical protein